MAVRVAFVAMSRKSGDIDGFQTSTSSDGAQPRPGLRGSEVGTNAIHGTEKAGRASRGESVSRFVRRALVVISWTTASREYKKQKKKLYVAEENRNATMSFIDEDAPVPLGKIKDEPTDYDEETREMPEKPVIQLQRRAVDQNIWTRSNKREYKWKTFYRVWKNLPPFFYRTRQRLPQNGNVIA